MKEKTSPTQRVLNLWAIILIVWSIYRATFKTDLPVWFDEFIAKPAIFILPVMWFFGKEKKNFFKSMDWRLKTLPSDLILGGVVGVIFLLIGYIGMLSRSHRVIIPTVSATSFALMIAVALATSISEEVLSRGFVLKRLFQESHNRFSSIGLSSVLFFVLHVPILFTVAQVNGAILMQVMITDILLSVAISLLYLDRKSLTLAIIIHLFYALSLSLFL
jgi:membrane protease YdiL (CAAX protease family)